MPNPFYTKLFNAAPRTTASSSAVNQEFAALQTAFNALSDTPIFAGPVRLAAGSAAAPALASSADLDTGLYFPGANSLALTTGGTAALVIDSSSSRRVLIGPTSSIPQVTVISNLLQPRLQVGGTTQERSAVGIYGFNGAIPSLTLAASASATVGGVDGAASGGLGVISFNASTGTGFEEVGYVICQTDGARGTTTPGRMTFGVKTSTNNALETLQLRASGTVVLGVGVGTTSTDGFVYIPAGTGVPTGVPTSQGAALCPLYVDRTNNRFYVYTNGAWRYAALV